jgi:3-hydroxy-3-methylglutaryl CoA synthase
MNEQNNNPSQLLRSVSVRSNVPDDTRQYGSPDEMVDESVDREGYIDNTAKSLRSIEIDPLSSGFLVRVGCQSIAIETPDKLIYTLTKYLTDPTKFESEWYSKDVINKLDNIK